ncbi:MAG: redox-sensing transcriptional repressor Rex [Fibrobacterales bacterium]
MADISPKSIERLCRYRKVLQNYKNSDKLYIFSHDLAVGVNNSSAQVRRDLMDLSVRGSSKKGYLVEEFLKEINAVLNSSTAQRAGIIGVGNLGRAILSYFSRVRMNITIDAAFDDDETKIDRVIAGCNSYHISQLQTIVKREAINVGIIAVPGCDAQAIADDLIAAGVKGIVNFAPVQLNIPKEIYLENIDITMTIEKTAFFAYNQMSKGEKADG